MDIKRLSEFKKEDLKGKRVFVRADFDVALTEELEIKNTFRIDRALPTIKHILDNGASLVLATKLGRPEEKKLSTVCLVNYLEKVIGKKVVFLGGYAETVVFEKIKAFTPGFVGLFENVRFYNEEGSSFTVGEVSEASELAKAVGETFNLFVNEAFAMCHRDEFSVTGAARLLPAMAGFNLEKEIDVLSGVMESPKHPLTLVVGGVKAESKPKVVGNFIDKADAILVGGRLMFSEEFTPFKGRNNLHLGGLTTDGLDIDSQTVAKFKDIITKSATIIWAGPMGKFEDAKSELGTRELVSAITQSAAYKVAGGGDTIAAIEKFSDPVKFDFVSTGGGAMLDFLAGKALPGVEVLKLS